MLALWREGRREKVVGFVGRVQAAELLAALDRAAPAGDVAETARVRGGDGTLGIHFILVVL